MPPDDVAAIAAETGASQGRRTWDVGAKMEAEDPGRTDYPFSGAMFLSYRPLDPPDPRVSVLSGDIGDAVATALDAAGGKNLEILGADVVAQCFQRGLVDEVPVYVLPVLLGDGVRFSAPGMTRTELEPLGSAGGQSTTILRFRPQVGICPTRKEKSSSPERSTQTCASVLSPESQGLADSAARSAAAVVHANQLRDHRGR